MKVMRILNLNRFNEKMKIMPLTDDEFNNIHPDLVPETEDTDNVFKLCGKHIQFMETNSNKPQEPVTYKHAVSESLKTGNGWRLPTKDEIKDLFDNYDAVLNTDSLVFKNEFGDKCSFTCDGESVDSDNFSFYEVYWIDDMHFWTCNNSSGTYKIAKSHDSEDVASVRLCREIHLKR